MPGLISRPGGTARLAESQQRTRASQSGEKGERPAEGGRPALCPPGTRAQPLLAPASTPHGGSSQFPPGLCLKHLQIGSKFSKKLTFFICFQIFQLLSFPYPPNTSNLKIWSHSCTFLAHRRSEKCEIYKEKAFCCLEWSWILFLSCRQFLLLPRNTKCFRENLNGVVLNFTIEVYYNRIFNWLFLESPLWEYSWISTDF